MTITAPLRADAQLAAARGALDALRALRATERPGSTDAPRPTADRRADAAAFFRKALDRDGDGSVTAREFLTAAKAVFGHEEAEAMARRLDQNQDGAIGTTEMIRDLTGGAPVLGALFERLFDMDGDGSVHEAELLALTARRVPPEEARAMLRAFDRNTDREAGARELRQGFAALGDGAPRFAPREA